MVAAIEFNNVWKSFKLGQNVDSLRDLIPYIFNRNRNKSHIYKKKRETFWALQDVSFKINKGESLGLIGPNGSGKTTTLKLLSGILRQTKGEIVKNGRIGALIEVGAGFHGDLTGRENIYLNGQIMGMKKREIDKKFDKIISFAEVEDFADTPVKRFSTGMYVRLGFSVAAHLEPDIFLIDEVLAVGDASFQRKCVQKIKELKLLGVTIVFVSHHMGLVETICDKAILLQSGKKVKHEKTNTVISYYQQAELNKLQQKGLNKERKILNSKIKKFEIISATSQKEKYIKGESIKIEIHLANRSDQFANISLVVDIYSESGLMLHRSSTYSDNIQVELRPGHNAACFETEASFFSKGGYSISVEIRGENDDGCDDWKPSIAYFEVKGTLPDLGGFFSLPRKWNVLN